MVPLFLRRLARMFGLGAGQSVGARGEDAAAAYLRRHGYTLLDRNVRVPMGEVDIVARHGTPENGVIVVVEVKTRVVDPSRSRPRAEEQVGAFKRRKLTLILNHLTRANGWERMRKRIDIVAVEYAAGSEEAPPVIRHLVNAVGR